MSDIDLTKIWLTCWVKPYVTALFYERVTPVYVGFRITGVESNICWFSFLPTFPIINKTDGPKMKRKG